MHAPVKFVRFAHTDTFWRALRVDKDNSFQATHIFVTDPEYILTGLWYVEFQLSLVDFWFYPREGKQKLQFWDPKIEKCRRAGPDVFF